MTAPSPSSVSGGDTDADKANVGSDFVTAESRSEMDDARQGYARRNGGAKVYCCYGMYADVGHDADCENAQPPQDSPADTKALPSEQKDVL